MSVDQAAAGPRVTTLLRLAVTGGRADLMRIVLTVVGSAAATVVLLTAATVASVGPSDGPYGLEVLNEPGLRPGVMVVLLLLCVPILSFVGQCVRVGAPARDRRLAAFRMAGERRATPARSWHSRPVWLRPRGPSSALSSTPSCMPRSVIPPRSRTLALRWPSS